MLQRVFFGASPIHLPYRWRQPGCVAGYDLHSEKLHTTRYPQPVRAFTLALFASSPGERSGRITHPAARGWLYTHVFSSITENQHRSNNLWIKDESRNPTASFKDRASAVVVARAIEIGADVIVTASTGNAGAALAGMSAAVGQKAVIFAPKTAPPAKVAQLLVFGAQVLLVDGTYDDAFDLTILAAQEFGWYCRNTGYNPFTAEGKKTAAFEIWEWLLLNQPEILHNPFHLFVSVGDGNIISGIHKGFKDLAALGWLETMPCIYGVQAEGSAAIANAFMAGNEKSYLSPLLHWQIVFL